MVKWWELGSLSLPHPSIILIPELAFSPSKHLKGPPKTLSFGDSNGLWKTQSSLPGLRA